MKSIAQLVADAEAMGATVVRSPSACVIIVPSATAARESEYVSLDEAKTVGRFRTTRQIREAIASGELRALGKQRSRLVKRDEFLAWLEGRKAKPIDGPATDAIERRVIRLAAERKKRTA